MARDLDLDSNADVYTDGSNDLAVNDGLENVLQSIAIHVRSSVKTLIGETITPAFLNEAEENIRGAIERDENIAEIVNFEIVEVNKQLNTVTVECSTVLNDFGRQTIQLGE